MKLEKIIFEDRFAKVSAEGNRQIKVYSADYSPCDVFREAMNQSIVAEATPYVWKILDAGKTKDGLWFVESEYEYGKTLAELMCEHPEKEDEYLNLMISLQIELYKRTVHDMVKLSDKMFRKIEEADMSATLRCDLHMRLLSMPKTLKICHGNFRPQNITLTADGRPFVTDWAHATLGNSGADIARTYLMFILDGKKELGEKYISLMCERANQPLEYIYRWMPIVAASQSVKNIPGERDTLMYFINSPNY